MTKNILFIITFSILSLTCYAADRTIEITDAWARKSMSQNNNSAAYLKINNLGDVDIKVIAASAPEISNYVELHKSFVDEDGVSRMVAIDKIVIPAKTTVELLPGGIHIMLCDLKRNLNVGDKFNIDIKFEIEGRDEDENETIIVQTEVK